VVRDGRARRPFAEMAPEVLGALVDAGAGGVRGEPQHGATQHAVSLLAEIVELTIAAIVH